MKWLQGLQILEVRSGWEQQRDKRQFPSRVTQSSDHDPMLQIVPSFETKDMPHNNVDPSLNGFRAMYQSPQSGENRDDANAPKCPFSNGISGKGDLE